WSDNIREFIFRTVVKTKDIAELTFILIQRPIRPWSHRVERSDSITARNRIFKIKTQFSLAAKLYCFEQSKFSSLNRRKINVVSRNIICFRTYIVWIGPLKI